MSGRRTSPRPTGTSARTGECSPTAARPTAGPARSRNCVRKDSSPHRMDESGARAGASQGAGGLEVRNCLHSGTALVPGGGIETWGPLRPFARDPKRWEKESSRALRAGHVRGPACSAACELVLVHERTPWGWLTWTVLGDGSAPQTPHRIGVLTPGASHRQRLALRWLTRRPARRLGLGGFRSRLAALRRGRARCHRLCRCPARGRGRCARRYRLAAGPAGPLLAEHLPDRLDARAREHVRSVGGDSACRYLQRLACLHACLVEAAAGSDRYELRRSAEVGRHCCGTPQASSRARTLARRRLN